MTLDRLAGGALDAAYVLCAAPHLACATPHALAARLAALAGAGAPGGVLAAVGTDPALLHPPGARWRFNKPADGARGGRGSSWRRRSEGSDATLPMRVRHRAKFQTAATDPMTLLP